MPDEAVQPEAKRITDCFHRTYRVLQVTLFLLMITFLVYVIFNDMPPCSPTW